MCYVVLETILLSNIDEPVGSYFLYYDWVSSTRFSVDIVSTRNDYFNVEVDEASCAPTIVILCKILANTILQDICSFSVLYSVDVVVLTEIEIYRLILIFTFNSELYGSSESISRIRWDVIFK